MIFVSELKYFLSAVFLFSSFSLAQDSYERQFDLAKQLYKSENYYGAITELKRLLFFDKDNQFLYEANELIGRCYKQGAKLLDAIRYFTLAEIHARNDEEIYKSRIEIIRLNILRRTTSRAHKLLDSLNSDKRFIDKKNEINYWRGWAYIFADEWEKAAKVFSSVDSLKKLGDLTSQVADDLYSVSFSKTISYFIPGAGQIYTGEYLSGVLSLGWNALLGYLAINSFVEERIFDGFVVSNFLWLRFYRGNIQNTEDFAAEKNLLISNKALNFLQYEYKGLKP